MIITRSAFLIILIFIYGVSCSDDNSKYLKNVRRIQRGTYNFNHPPSFQYEPIPVAVVYDESNSKGANFKKTVKENKLTLDHKDQEVNITVEVEDVEVSSTVDSITELVTETTTSSIKHKDIITELETETSTSSIKYKGRTFKDFQIPVAVVYVTEPRRLRSNEDVSVTIKPKSRRQGQQLKITKKRIDNRERLEAADKNPDTETKTLEPQVITQNENIKQFKERIEFTTNFPKRSKGADPIVPILESESYVFSHNGNFHYSYEGGDGTKASERGVLKTFDDKTKGEAVVGSYSYTDKDGKDFSLSYTADENGYRPVGAHLPTPPPIPPAIARALKYLATKKPDPNEPVTKSYF